MGSGGLNPIYVNWSLSWEELTNFSEPQFCLSVKLRVVATSKGGHEHLMRRCIYIKKILGTCIHVSRHTINAL